MNTSQDRFHMLAEDRVHTDEIEVTFVEITLQCPCAL